MPIGIRPINDFAYKKIFGSPANKLALISLLNAILDLQSPIVDLTIENPYNLQDFLDDKLSILDIKATDQSGAIYSIEMQLSIFAGQDYSLLKPVYSICLIDGIVWPDSTKVHHAFRLTDSESSRTLAGTLEIHTLEFGRYNLEATDLANASLLQQWLYWLLHAHEYESEELLRLFPQPAIQLATHTIVRIAEKTEDKTMYDAREKAIRDRQWALNASFREGEIKLIQTLQEILEESLFEPSDLEGKSLEELQAITVELRMKIAKRA